VTDFYKPGSPRNLTAGSVVINNKRRPRLGWTIYSEADLQNHKIYRRFLYASGEITSWELAATVHKDSSGWTDMTVEVQQVPKGVAPDGNYAEYYVQAVNTLGVASLESNHAQIPILCYTCEGPPPPTEKTATAPMPREFTMSKNYPNPFNPITTIKYALPEESFVSMRVFNTLGEEVSELVDAWQEANWYEIRWNAGNAPSGVYYLRMSDTDAYGKSKYQEFRKLLLVK
jgi:hypothetical protein